MIQGVEYVTAIEAAQHIGVARQTIYRWIDAGLISDVIDLGEKARTRYLIPADAVIGFVPPSHEDGSKGRRAGTKIDGR